MYRKLDIPGRGKLAHALDEPASDPSVRRAAPDDAEVVGRLLHDFNTEFDDLTPGPTALAERVRELLAAGETTILLGSLGGSGVARSRGAALPSLDLDARAGVLRRGDVRDPDRRGQGLGRALMEEAIELARREGADYMDLGTSEDDAPPAPLTRASGSPTASACPTARRCTSTSGSCSPQAYVTLGSRQRRSNGRRHLRGAISSWIASGPHEPVG